ncbi:MAG: TonB-dependent receptor [Chlorobi bacterium]|nr:TonB-dependent receptor [Chlorobiota bacterium]
MKKIIISVFLIFISVSFLQAQDMCVVRGKVTDGETGEALPGAIAMVDNSDPAIVSVTDYDGNFSLENVPVNTKKIIISFLSYETKIIENLNLPAGGVKVINLLLEKTDSEISEVFVSAKSLTNTENAMISYQKKSSGLVNGISSQQISKLGDSDAASALKRVSGVSVSGGKYVFIRGLSDRYSMVSLNGGEIPGLDPNKNTVQMDMFPSNIIDNIIVYKSFTPDLPASFTGGYINIVTKTYPEKFTLSFSTSFGYNTQSSLNKQFLTYEGGRYDVLGIDDGTRSIPAAAAGYVPFLYENNDELDKITGSFNKIMKTSYKKSFLNHSHAFSVGNQIKLFGKPFGFIFSGSCKRDFSSYDNGVYGRYNLIESGSAGIMNPLISETEQKGDEEVMMSFLAGFSYKINRNNSISLTFLRDNSGLKSARYREGQKPEDNLYMYEHVLGFQERKFLTEQISGIHVFPNILNLKIDWISSYTLSEQREPDLRFFNYDGEANQYSISYNAYPSPARFYRNLSEINSDTKINFTFPVKVFQKKSKFKAGGAYTYKSRISESRKFDILSQGLDFNGRIEDYLSDAGIGQNAENATYGLYVSDDVLTDAYNSYTASEYISAGYAMIDIDLLKKMKLITGMRYEYSYTYIENNVDPSNFKHVRAEQALNDFLPVLNLKYSLNKNSNLRLVYARTVARPAFREIAPYAYYDFKEGWRVVGNPELKRTLIDNADLRYELFGKNGDIFSVSLFYKYFNNPIELIDDPRANNAEFHYVNVDNSKMYGFETELKKHLNEINMPNFSIGGNYSLLKSQVKYVENFGSEDNSGVILQRPMYEQAPWVANAYLSYDNSDKGLNINAAFNIEGDKLAVVTKGATPNIYKKAYPDLKFNISKTFGKYFKIKFNVSNILNQNYKKSYNYKGKEYIFQSYKLGRTYSLSLSYDVN